jgi:hypothetical protein
MAAKKDGIGSEFWKGVGGAFGAAVFLGLASLYEPFWKTFSGSMQTGWSHLMASSQYPNWSAYLVSLLAAMSLLRWALSAWRSRTDSTIRFNQFNEGGDVLWSWGSISSHPVGLVPYCPTCSTQLVFRYDDGEGLYFGGQRHTELICQRCNRHRVVLREPGDYEDLIKRIKREIDRLIRTGEWRRHVPDSLPK